MKTALREAFEADEKELAKRMRAMRRTVTSHDVTAWAESFMSELAQVRDSHGKALRPS